MQSVFVSIIILMAISICNAKGAKFSVLKSSDNIMFIKEDIASFAKNNPESHIIPMEKVNQQQQQKCMEVVRFSVGSRENDDNILNEYNSNNNYNPPRDISLRLGYPNYDGLAEIITLVEIDASYLSDEVKAYVVNGGIGQRFMQIVIEAKDTSELSYTARFFGKN